MCWLYEAAFQMIPDLSADLFFLQPQPPRGLLDGNSPGSRRYLMTDGSSQTHVMVSTAKQVVVLAQQLGHSLALCVACTAIAGCLVQLLDVGPDCPLPFGRALSGTFRHVSQRRPYILLLD